jgi:hypothetical protein
VTGERTQAPVYPGFEAALRRIVTGEDQQGRSVTIVDGPPASALATPGSGGLLEIWAEALGGALDPRSSADQGPQVPWLSPEEGCVKVRWFIVEPAPPDMPADALTAAIAAQFAAFGGADHLVASPHPAMHRTDTLDIICCLAGDVSLVLDDGETRLGPGNVVIQRGVAHSWRAHGGPALMLAVLIARDLHNGQA